MAGPQVSELLQFLLNINKVSATVLSFFKCWVLIEKNSDWSICIYNYIEVHRYNSFQSPLSLTVWFVLPNIFLWKIKIFLVLRPLITTPHLSPFPLSHSHLFSVTPSKSFSLHLHACKGTHIIYMWVCYRLDFINSKT